MELKTKNWNKILTVIKGKYGIVDTSGRVSPRKKGRPEEHLPYTGGESTRKLSGREERRGY